MADEQYRIALTEKLEAQAETGAGRMMARSPPGSCPAPRPRAPRVGWPG